MRQRLLLACIILVGAATAAQAQKRPNDFTRTDIDGNTYSLYEELGKGKPVIIDFFFYTCHACRGAAPAMEKLWQDYRDRAWIWKFDVYDNETAEMVRSFKKEFGTTYPGFTKGQDLVVYFNQEFGLQFFTPGFVVILPDTTVAFVGVGGNNVSTLRKTLDEYFNSISSVDDPTVGTEAAAIYPNPAAGPALLTFGMTTAADVSAELYNALGSRVAVIFQGRRSAGAAQQLQVETEGLPEGTYYVRLRRGERIDVLPITIVR